MKPAGSTVPPAARMVFEGVGLDFDKYKAKGGQIIQVDVGQIPQHDARRPRRPLLRERLARASGHARRCRSTVPVRFVDLPEKSLAVLGKNGMKVHPMPAVVQGPERPDARRWTSAPT